MKIGLDIGSTTIKSIVLDDNDQVIYKSYNRHYSHIKEKVIEELQFLSDKFNLKNFHQYILDMGPVQFDILFNNLDAWIKKEK